MFCWKRPISYKFYIISLIFNVNVFVMFVHYFKVVWPIW
jgi:hypothetical protein